MSKHWISVIMCSTCYINLLLKKLFYTIGPLISCVKTCTYRCRYGKVDDSSHSNPIPAAGTEQHQAVACLVEIYVWTWWNLNWHKLAHFLMWPFGFVLSSGLELSIEMLLTVYISIYIIHIHIGICWVLAFPSLSITWTEMEMFYYTLFTLSRLHQSSNQFTGRLMCMLKQRFICAMVHS